jgi:cell division protein FtsL
LLHWHAAVTLRAIDYTRNRAMKAIVALFAALLLTAAEFLVMDYDTRQRVVLYQAQAPTAIAVRK